MLRLVRHCVLVVVAGGLLLAQPLLAAEGVTGNLVSAKWLQQNLNNPDVVLLDVSPAQIYGAKHIPGALGVDFLTYGYPERPLADMEQRYQSWGISPGKKVVMYDQGGTYMATRLFFALQHHGFPPSNLFVLDGGLAKWEELGLPVTKDAPPAREKGSFKITKVNEEVRTRLPEMLTASGDLANNVLLEALGPDWHFGETAPFGKAGHIPMGVMLPAADFFNADKTFKSADEIKRMLTYVGIKPEQRIHSYCGGGVAASVPFFATKFIANYPKVALFVESEMGWASDPRDLPFWTYDAPFLMRDATWLQGWGGRMMRMYGVSAPNVIDVRPAAAYTEGHVPFAVNVPGDVFKANLTTPEKLAQTLGTAGVNPAHEAVIVSGSGITKESALAFVMLEKLGHKKVSLLVDPADRWAQAGLKVTKEPTVIGARKSPADLAIPPATYAANIRTGIVISDPKSTEGVYPKIFVASGTTVPAQTREGKVVHVPYTDLLNADGTPKAAKDIWNIVSKAGVPRYAELVFFSDDPGEAAANYFIFKLMGFPDVKVLVNATAASPSDGNNAANGVAR